MTNSIQKEDSPENNNKVFVGVKHFLNYIKSITFQFTKSENDEVTIIARGKQITKAVDLAEVMKKKQVDGKNISVKRIKIGNLNLEELNINEGKFKIVDKKFLLEKIKLL